MKRLFTITLGPILVLLLILTLTRGVGAQSGGNYDVEWQVLGSAGDQFAIGGNYQVGFTVGQALPPGISSGGSYQIVQGYWAGGGFQPTAVELLDFTVEPRGNTLVVCWETASEFDILGFNLYRSTIGEPGSFEQINDELIPSQAQGGGNGARYEWVDTDVNPGQVYFYVLESVSVDGSRTEHGPVQGLLPDGWHIYLPVLTKGL